MINLSRERKQIIIKVTRNNARRKLASKTDKTKQLWASGLEVCCDSGYISELGIMEIAIIDKQISLVNFLKFNDKKNSFETFSVTHV